MFPVQAIKEQTIKNIEFNICLKLRVASLSETSEQNSHLCHSCGQFRFIYTPISARPIPSVVKLSQLTERHAVPFAVTFNTSVWFPLCVALLYSYPSLSICLWPLLDTIWLMDSPVPAAKHLQGHVDLTGLTLTPILLYTYDFFGCVMSHVATRRFINVEARVRFQDSPCEVYDVISGTHKNTLTISENQSRYLSNIARRLYSCPSVLTESSTVCLKNWL